MDGRPFERGGGGGGGGGLENGGTDKVASETLTDFLSRDLTTNVS